MRRAGVGLWLRRSGRRVWDLSQEALEHRILWVAIGEVRDVASRFPLERGPAGGIAGRLADERRGEHPRSLDLRQVSLARGAAQVANPARRVAAAEPDELCHEPRERARAAEPILIDAEPQVAVPARRVCGEDAGVRVAHRLAVFRRAPGVAVEVPLAGAVSEGRGEPEVTSRAARPGARALHGEVQE